MAAMAMQQHDAASWRLVLPPRTAGCMMLACLSCSSVASELLTAAGRIIKLNTFCPCELVSLFHCSVRFILAAWGFGLERRAWGYDRLSNARWHQLTCIALPAGKEHLYDLEAEMGIPGQILYCLYEASVCTVPPALHLPWLQVEAVALASQALTSGNRLIAMNDWCMALGTASVLSFHQFACQMSVRGSGAARRWPPAHSPCDPFTCSRVCFLFTG